ncbi:hypothetical protein ACS0TY_005703 [Phlomoides rotata]
MMAAGMEDSAPSRQRIVNKIVETLRRHLRFSEQGEGLQVLIDMAARFEESVYSTARSRQTEYLRKISLKMLASIGPVVLQVLSC